MSANDQRPKGQPSQVSNGSGGKEEDAYLQQPPHPTMRAWSEQASDGAYGAGPMSTAVSDSFFPNYYPPNMSSYPFMSQGMGGSEGAWSSGADTMFGMGYDYGGNMYSGFGFPFNNWDYSDYWGSTQPVRKDQRGYPAEDAYYPTEMIPPDSYGMVNGGGPPPETQEPVANVEQGIRNMRLAYGKEETIQPPPQQQQQPQQHLQHVVAEGFGGDPSLMMPPSPVSTSGPSMNVGNSGGSNQGGGQSSKKTSWAAIASQPARPQLQMRPRTIPRAPVHPSKTHNMDIGTWDTRGNPSRVPLTMSQPLPNQPPPSLARNSRPPLLSQRQTLPPSTSVTVYNSSNNNSGSGNSSNTNANLNSSSSYSNTVDNSSVNNNNSNVSNATSNDNSGVNIDSSNSNNMPGSGSGGNSPYSGHSNSSGNPDSNNRTVVATSATVNGTHGEPQASAPVAEANNSEKTSTFYNPKEFVLNHKSARYFIIKSYSEDDIHRSIKYAIWCSTDHGNRRLDAAFRERESKGPVYLIFSVNGSGHFCGVAQMMSAVDYNKCSGIWHQDKWKGQIEVKWVYVKDVPNSQLRHIRLENNDNKPVTNSRDTQEVPPEKGKQVLRIMHSYKHTTSIFDDFPHYEKRQEEDRIMSMYRDTRDSNRGGHGGGERGGHGGGGDRGGHGGGGDRGGHGGSDHRGGHGGSDHRGGHGGGDHRGGHGGGDRRGGHGGGDHRGGHGGGDRDHHGGQHHRDNRDRDNHGRGGGNDYRSDGRDGRDNRYDNRGDNRGDKDHHRGGFDREIRGRPGGMNDRDNRRGGHRQY